MLTDGAPAGVYTGPSSATPVTDRIHRGSRQARPGVSLRRITRPAHVPLDVDSATAEHPTGRRTDLGPDTVARG
jgi:hypothetical protein